MALTGDHYPGAHAARSPDHPAIIMASSGSVTTYRQLHDAAIRIASQIQALSGSSAHLALCVENRPEFFAVAWAAIYAGMTFTPVSTKLTSDEITYIINDCSASIVVASAETINTVARCRGACPAVDHWASVDGGSDGFIEIDPVSTATPGSLSELEGSEMLYSSGTTGRPKGIVRTGKPRLLGEPDDAYLAARALFGISDTTVYLSPAPLYHAAPLLYTRFVHRAGGTVVQMERFGAEDALAAIERYGVTVSQWVPTMFVRMLKLPVSLRHRHDLSSMDVAIHAAAPCPREVKEAMIEWWGPVLHEYYGGSEGNGLTYCTSADWLARRGTVGRAVIGNVHVLSENGDEVEPGTEGRVYFSGGPTFEYHRDAEATFRSRDPKGRGWSTLGDIGFLDADGYLFLTDREANVIITGGVNVYPQEAEDILVGHPLVADAAVVGVPDAEFGEAVHAVVQLVTSDGTPADLAEDLLAYCRARLSSVKCPRSIEFRHELPRHPNGKLYKRQLRDEFWRDQGSRLAPGAVAP